MVSDPFIGVDIRLINGDLGTTSIGDLDLVGNVDPMDNMRQAINMRLLTPLGKYYFAQGYGTKAGQFVDEPDTEANRKNLEAEGKATIMEDPRISTVTNITVATTGVNQVTLSYSAITKGGKTLSGSAQIGGQT